MTTTMERHYADEEPEVTTITTGWELTDEDHGFCGFCGWKCHIASTCPNRPEAA